MSMEALGEPQGMASVMTYAELVVAYGRNERMPIMRKINVNAMSCAMFSQAQQKTMTVGAHDNDTS